MRGFTDVPPGRSALILGGAIATLLVGAEVEGKGLERRTAPIGSGAEGTLNVTLKPGRYELYCPLGGGAHKQAGMKTMVTVTEDSAPSSQY